jgi:hypothetical protein
MELYRAMIAIKKKAAITSEFSRIMMLQKVVP